MICSVYTAKKTTIPDIFAHIQKESQPDHLYYWPNDEVLVPNVCIYWCPTIGMNLRTKEVGYLNLNDFDVKTTEEEEGGIRNVTETVRVVSQVRLSVLIRYRRADICPRSRCANLRI